MVPFWVFLGALPILVYSSGDWDLHWGCEVLTHGCMTRGVGARPGGAWRAAPGGKPPLAAAEAGGCERAPGPTGGFQNRFPIRIRAKLNPGDFRSIYRSQNGYLLTQPFSFR